MESVRSFQDEEGKEAILDINSFEKVAIGLASPSQIRSWSQGEVKKPETINYRTLKPEREGLFCEKIFGPTKDWECHCGKYKRVRYKGIVCDRCGVEVTQKKVRRERMGHIELAAPVSHIWFFKGIPSRLGLLMDMSPKDLEKTLYYAQYIVIDPGETSLMEKQLLTEAEYRNMREKFGNAFKAGMGAGAVKEILANMDLEEESRELREDIKSSSGQRRRRAVRRLEVVEAFHRSDNKPEWLILEVIPVIPPELRPMVQLDGGRFATSDLNDLYRRVINRNNRLKRLLDLGAPDIIVRNEKRMLQEAVDALIDNGRRGRAVTGPGNRPLKSLSDMLKGKQGRFRQNLLGKRVDYSGRSVIINGPELKLHQCGVPKEMALELFKPFVMKELVEQGFAQNVKNAKTQVEQRREEVWDVLEEVIQGHPVLLNRAPTLHRLGIQAFEPVLIDGRAIQLHPLVCPPYNADYDGDQMAIHVPLSAEAQAEARVLMLSKHNILNPKNGEPIVIPTQDMVLGCYYITLEDEEAKGAGKHFASFHDCIMAFENDAVELHAPITLHYQGQKMETTVGRVIFNDILHPELRFKNKIMGMDELSKIISECFHKLGLSETTEMLDRIKETGYHYSTVAGTTISIVDAVIPEEKQKLIEDAEKQVEEITEQYRRGLLTDQERYEKILEVWHETKEIVTDKLAESFDRFNPLNMMVDSAARGNMSQITQLGGMRGLMADPSGRTLEVPVKSNFREGLTVLEYFTSTHGARKGLADTALRTADSGYLTRRLVDVTQGVVVQERDCGTNAGIVVENMVDDGEMVKPFDERILGRVAAEDVVHPETEEMIVARDEEIDEEALEQIRQIGLQQIRVRSLLTCETEHGVCAKCYGRDLATGQMVNVGESVGVIAAQSIGEPGTQLTMRTFHTGGVAGDDITQGLPRAEELFEARTPKMRAFIAERDGEVEFGTRRNKTEIRIVYDDEGNYEGVRIPHGADVKVEKGERVEAGQELTRGSIDPTDVLRVMGVRACEKYLLKEIQKVYSSHGVEIDDKHIEIVIRQMMKKVRIRDAGDTNLLPGSLVNQFEFRKANARLEEGEEPATAEPELLGITKASLATESFLSAASFQRTTQVLTEASIEGKTDALRGLKENVILGKLVPCGTGLRRYRKIDTYLEDKEVSSTEMTEDEGETQAAGASEDKEKEKRPAS